ncbi:MAG: hypothetical protein QM747_02895 [Nocardioides sp.]
MRTRSLGAGMAALGLSTFGLVALAAPSSAADVRCHGHVATIVGTDGDDTLTGTSGADVIVGLGGNDTIRALGGDDILCGDDGADQLYGGDGDDLLYGGNDEIVDTCDDACFEYRGGDLIDGGAGDDFLDAGQPDEFGSSSIGDTVTYAGSSAGVRVDLRSRLATGEGRDRLSAETSMHQLRIDGSAHRDVIIGNAKSQYVDAGAGADVVRTGPGSDDVDVTKGKDSVSTGSGDDYVAVEATASRSGVRVSLGSGDDTGSARSLGAKYAFSGGPGFDSLGLDPSGRTPFKALLAKGRVVRAGATTHTAGFEAWSVDSTSPATLIGGAERDVVRVFRTPRLTARLAGGRDLLDDRADHGKIDMGAGDDTLWAPEHGTVKATLGSGDDLLRGEDDGPAYGHKVVRGGPGRDSTVAKSYDFTCSGFEKGSCRGDYPAPKCDGKTATLVGRRSGSQQLVGTGGDDVIVANGPHDTVDGRGGDDTICGGGDGTLSGGPGGDTVIGRDQDHVSGNAGDDQLVLRDEAVLDYSGATGPVTIDIPAGTASGEGSDTVRTDGSRLFIAGSAFADQITGGVETDVVSPGAGNDTVHTGAGDDTVQDEASGSGDDSVDLGPGGDSYVLRSGSDSVDGGADQDRVEDRSTGQRGPVTLTGFESTELSGLADGDSTTDADVQWDVLATGSATVDLAAGTISVGGRTGHFAPGGDPGFRDLGATTVTGTPGPDQVFVSTESTSALTAHLLGGDDGFEASGFHGGSVDLGDGDDLLTGAFTGMELIGGAGTDALHLSLSSGNTCTGFESGTCNPG